MSENRVYAVVPAAGKGERFGGDTPKQYLMLNGRSVLEHTLSRLAAHRKIARVVVAIAGDDGRFDSLAARLPSKVVAVDGGAERCHSVLAGLEWLCHNAQASSWVMVHDAARPCIRGSDIDRMITEVGAGEPGAILGVPVRDTLKRSDQDNRIVDTIDRTVIWRALTPQMFQLGALRDAIESALDSGVIVTDEAQAMERSGMRPKLVHGHADNIKITHPEDLELAELIMQAQDRTREVVDQ
jgi:2-C-methyl-D-erythritol 4-phosphate cytidylyltransferase